MYPPVGYTALRPLISYLLTSLILSYLISLMFFSPPLECPPTAQRSALACSCGERIQPARLLPSDMPTSVVTGAAGRLGAGIAAALRRRGHRVIGVDIQQPPAEAACTFHDFFTSDLSAAAVSDSPAGTALDAACAGADVVVHCAAWPGPSSSPPPAVVASGSGSTSSRIGLESASPALLLRDNVGSTSAVCDAAVRGGATRFVFSSSAFAMGYGHCPTGPQSLQPRYLPIDEAHGALPLETYGLSKLCGEQVLQSAARTAKGVSFVSLRFPNIVKTEKWAELPWAAPTADAPLTLLLWAYAAEADVVDAHVQAAVRPEAAAAGTHEAYILAAPTSRFAEPTLELLASSLGMTAPPPLRAGGMRGNASPLDSSKAASRLGWAPRSWQQAATAHPVPRRPPTAAPPPPTAAPPPPTAAPPPPTAAPPPMAYGLGSTAAHRARADPGLLHFDLGGFELASGAKLPAGATLAYKVYGPPVGSGVGVVLHPTSFDAVHDDLEHSIGPGRLLDTREYTVVVPNLLGNGVSYSPSRDVPYLPPSAGVPYVPPWYVPRLPPPTFVSIADNVAAQHALLRHLGLKCDASQPLALIYGYSMGALQAYEWAVRAPDGVERIAAVCGAARCGELNRIFLRSLAAALQADAAWDPLLCRFTRRPARGLEAFASVYAGWGVGERFYVDKAYEAAGYASADVFLEVSE